MTALGSRLRRAEKRLAQRAGGSSPEGEEWWAARHAVHAWIHGGCVGPYPPAGPRPAKYATEEEWQADQLAMIAVLCRLADQPDPPGLTERLRAMVQDRVDDMLYVGRLVAEAHRQLEFYEHWVQGRLAGNPEAAPGWAPSSTPCSTGSTPTPDLTPTATPAPRPATPLGAASSPARAGPTVHKV